MFGISWAELLIVAVLALIVIGPNELPYVLKNAGKMLGKLKALANDFMTIVDEETENPANYIKDLDGKVQKTHKVPKTKK